MTGAGNDGARPVVAIWKSTWLPPSQTFIRSQVNSLRRWDPLLLGLRTDPHGIPMPVHRAPFGWSVPARILRRGSALTGYRFFYDRLLEQHRVQLVHAHFGPSAIDVLPVARRAGLPLVVTFHGYDVTRLPYARDGEAYRRKLAAVLDYADLVLPVSHFVADKLLELGAPPEKVRVRYIGSPPPPPAASPAGAVERAGITFVGRFVDLKGAADFVTAIEMLPRDLLESTPVRMVGDGPLLEPLRRRIAERQLPITLLGRLDLHDVHVTLARSSIFCAPSRADQDGASEAFGIVYVEAAAHGLPVVAYCDGGVGEAVLDGVTGLLAPAGDVAALAARLQQLLERPELARALGEAGARRAAAEFDITSRTALLEQDYDEVRDAHRRR